MTAEVSVAHGGATVLAMAVTAGAGLAACALTLLAEERPVRTVGIVAAVAVGAAVLSGWRWLGSAATLATTAAVLLAAAISDDVGPGHLVVASVLLLVLVAGLDRVERPGRSAGSVVLNRTRLPRRAGVPVLAVVATAGVAVTATAPVVPSAGLVLLGLAAGLGALLVATRST